MTDAPGPLKLVFCGTPSFAVPTLEALLAAGHEIPLVVSQPDRPVGRHQQLTAPPVKQAALAAGLRVVQPAKIRNNPEFRAQLEAIAPDAIVVVAYGRIIPPWMLALPRLGCINLHGSLLPKYRGAAPIQWAVAMGEALTGNTTMLLEEGLDTGPILLQQPLEIGPHQTAADLFVILARSGAPLERSSPSSSPSRASPSPPSSTAKTVAWTLPPARLPSSTTVGVASSPGPALSPLLTAKSSSFIAWKSPRLRALPRPAPPSPARSTSKTIASSPPVPVTHGWSSSSFSSKAKSA
jgi:methionyl-tRNA formyltransferase